MEQQINSIVMIVDDQPDLVEGIKLILEEENYEVWTAGNGQQALNKLEESFNGAAGETSANGRVMPDLILADIMMPVMDGYSLYEEIRSNPYLNHIPFVFLTAKVNPLDIRQGKALGVDDYLTKPCLPEDLLATVEGKLRRNEQRRALQAQFMDDVGRMPAAGMIVLAAFVLTITLVVAATTFITMSLTG